MNSRSPLNWFREYPGQILSSPNFVMMDATARGIYASMRYSCWQNIATDGGIPNDDCYIQTVSHCTVEQWSERKQQILKNFEERDGKLYDPGLCAQSSSTFESLEAKRAAGRASGRARNEKAREIIKTDDDETDRGDREIDRQIDKAVQHPLNIRSTPDEHPFSNSSIEDSSAAPSLFNSGESAPHASPTSGRIAAPTSGVPLAHSFNPDTEGQNRAVTNPNLGDDIRQVKDACVSHGGKLPSNGDVTDLLTKYSAEEIVEALDEYADSLSSIGDENYLEYKFFREGGAHALISKMRREKAEEAKRESERAKRVQAPTPRLFSNL